MRAAAADGPRVPSRAGAFLLVVFAVGPALYWAHFLAVAVHELVGHGLVAWAVGGRFEGFMIAPDLFGWATVSPGPDPGSFPTLRRAAILAGGSVSTASAGLALLLLLTCTRRGGGWARLTAWVAAYALLMEGATYLFFTSIHPTGGDWARLLGLVDAGPWLRWVFVLVGGILTLGGLVLILRGGLHEVATLLPPAGDGGRGPRRWLLLAAVLPALPLVVFDWDQLAPGLWQWPNLAMILLHAGVADVLLRARSGPEWRPVPTQPTRVRPGAARTACTNAALSLATFASAWLVLRHGISWGD